MIFKARRQISVHTVGDPVLSKPAAPVLILGDADGNGVVESADATVLLRRFAYIDIPYGDVTLSHGDVNGDDSVDVLDVSLIQRYLANINTPYPIGEPF